MAKSLRELRDEHKRAAAGAPVSPASNVLATGPGFSGAPINAERRVPAAESRQLKSEAPADSERSTPASAAPAIGLRALRESLRAKEPTDSSSRDSPMMSVKEMLKGGERAVASVKPEEPAPGPPKIAHPPPGNRAEEDAAARRKSATLLLDLIPDGMMKVAGAGKSRVPAEAAGDPKERITARLADDGLCGRVGTKNDDLRKALQDVGRYHEVAGVTGGLFPIDATMAEAVRLWLKGDEDSEDR